MSVGDSVVQEGGELVCFSADGLSSSGFALADNGLSQEYELLVRAGSASSSRTSANRQGTMSHSITVASLQAVAPNWTVL